MMTDLGPTDDMDLRSTIARLAGVLDMVDAAVPGVNLARRYAQHALNLITKEET